MRAGIPLRLMILVLAAPFMANAQESPTSKSSCPARATIEGPSEIAEGKQITFSVSLSGKVVGPKVTYEWTVKPEVKSTGQGTTSLVAETAGYGGQGITVSLSVAGIDGCPTLVSWHTTYVLPPQSARIGQYTESTLELRQPLRQIAERELSKSPDANVFLIAHDRQTVARLTNVRHHKWANPLNTDEAMKMAQDDKQYLINAGISGDRIKILRGAPEAEVTVEFYLVPKGGIQPLANVAAGTPIGPRVELMWSLMPPSIVGDNFGGNVKRKYYCVEVTIVNHSGYEFQIGGIGFTVPSIAAQSNASQSSADIEIVRGTINHGKRTGFRNTSLAVIKGMGLVMTGVTPFFRSLSSQANFSKLINVLNNPVEVSFEMIFPDQTPHYLDRLDKMSFREAPNVRLSVPTHSSFRTLVFLPKDLINLPKANRDSPPEVLRALGNVFVLGDTVRHVERIKVTGRP